MKLRGRLTGNPELPIQAKYYKSELDCLTRVEARQLEK